MQLKSLLPFLLLSHLLVTLFFFALFAPSDTKYRSSTGNRRQLQQPLPHLEPVEELVPPAPLPTSQPSFEGEPAEKKIIYATVRSHHVAEESERIIQASSTPDGGPPDLHNPDKAARDVGPLSWAHETTGEPLKVKENHAVLGAVPEDGAGRPFFSIVVAAYNQGAFIEETLKSVLEQSYPHWELIVVDDGSPDDTWDRAAAFMESHQAARVRLLRKRNGGLADARNVGLRYARGAWLCMLDSDDLLGADYLLRAAQLVAEDLGALEMGIIPGCMRNFGAASSDWCFPEGYSLVGLSHWNKFHASVLMSARLMRAVGGYDPGVPWGLEDWNFWLRAARHFPAVRFVPEATFWYRQHAGSSMRKEMFASPLEETKAWVRTNHAGLFEPAQLLRDHEAIAAMSPATVLKLKDKVAAFPTAGMAHFWLALHSVRQLRVEAALSGLRTAAGLVKGENAWQVHYHTALLLEASDDLPGALVAINAAFRHAYHDDLLAAKYRIEMEAGAREKGPRGQGTGLVLVKPSYWGDEAQMAGIREASLAGRLALLGRLEGGAAAQAAQRESMLAAMAAVAAAPCSGKAHQGWAANQVRNPTFESGPDQWFPYGLGFAVSPAQPRPGVQSVLSAAVHGAAEAEGAGAMQVVQLHQEAPAALLVRGWSKAQNVSGAADAGYSVYVDINFADGTHEWGWALPFETGTHDWQLRSRHLQRAKAIATLDLYAMFRGHSGSALFDDMSVSTAASAACACPAGEAFSPGAPQSCERCPAGKLCLFGEMYDPA